MLRWADTVGRKFSRKRYDPSEVPCMPESGVMGSYSSFPLELTPTKYVPAPSCSSINESFEK
jgi:hypothetical protein